MTKSGFKKGTRSFIKSLIVLSLLTLTACASLKPCGELPQKPKFDYGWSPPFEITVDGETKEVQAMTVEDKEKLDLYIIFLENR